MLIILRLIYWLLFSRCARETQRKGWNTFGVQNYGECLSGDRASDTYFEEGEQLLFMAPTQPKPLLGCVDNEMNLCSGNNLECAGQENSNYVFSLDDGRWSMIAAPLKVVKS